MAAESAAILDELHALLDRFPVPQPLWHRYVPQMREVLTDFRAALQALSTLPAERAALGRYMEGEADRPPPAAGGPTVAAARARLGALPVPQGEHPYLDEIVVTLDAADIVLAALATPAGDAALAVVRVPA